MIVVTMRLLLLLLLMIIIVRITRKTMITTGITMLIAIKEKAEIWKKQKE